MAMVPPPYEEPAPDGRQYFKILGVSPHLIRMYDLLLTAQDLAALRPGGTGRSQAIQIDLLILDVKRKVEEAAKATAAESMAMIRAKIEATRVRPPTLGVKNSNSSMISGIVSRPVPSILPGGGAVGIADVDELIHATLSPSTNSKTPYYWRAQEFGSDHLVGKTLYGVFQPGDAAPSGMASRSHAIFEYRAKGTTPRFKMTVLNPIRERAFLREGAWDAYMFRKGLYKTIEASAIQRMRTIESGNLPGRGRKI
jgi:hypothetical protein